MFAKLIKFAEVCWIFIICCIYCVQSRECMSEQKPIKYILLNINLDIWSYPIMNEWLNGTQNSKSIETFNQGIKLINMAL